MQHDRSNERHSRHEVSQSTTLKTRLDPQTTTRVCQVKYTVALLGTPNPHICKGDTPCSLAKLRASPLKNLLNRSGFSSSSHHFSSNKKYRIHRKTSLFDRFLSTPLLQATRAPSQQWVSLSPPRTLGLRLSILTKSDCTGPCSCSCADCKCPAGNCKCK